MTDLKPEDLARLQRIAERATGMHGADQEHIIDVANEFSDAFGVETVLSLLADRARMEKALERLIPLAQKWEFVESRQFSYGGGGSEPSPAEWGVEVSYQQTREAGPFEQFLADVEAFHNSADEEADPEHPEWLHDSQIARQALGASQ